MVLRAFFIIYKGFPYLVTNQHIASDIGDAPFSIRLNKPDGTSDNLHVDQSRDPLRWYSNTNDPDVDLAVMPFNYVLPEYGYDMKYILEKMLLSTEQKEYIGIDDFC